MPKTMTHPEFARRLELACDGNPNVPGRNYGRLAWFMDRLKERGVSVTQETVRKWLAGETLPRQAPMSALAEILGQDEAWLAFGKSPSISRKQARVRDAQADGAVNLIAGIAQMQGATPAFPLPDDERATDQGIDLYLTIRGAVYSIHVATIEVDEKDDTLRAVIPSECITPGVMVLCVMLSDEMKVTIYEVTEEAIDSHGARKGAFCEVVIPENGQGVRVIENFRERF